MCIFHFYLLSLLLLPTASKSEAHICSHNLEEAETLDENEWKNWADFRCSRFYASLRSETRVGTLHSKNLYENLADADEKIHPFHI